MKKIIINNIVVILFLLAASALRGDGTAICTEPYTKEKLALLPQTTDYRNYFFLQSIDDSTSVIIGDFTGTDKLVVQILDSRQDNTIEKVIEFFPESKKYRVARSSVSQFFKENIKQLKQDIIEGTIFKEYSYPMLSLNTLRYKLGTGLDIYRAGESGYAVKFIDPDDPSTPMGEFFFRKNLGRYDLQFKTNFFKVYNRKTVPPLQYSVYCRNTKDPVIAEIVESLLKSVVK